MPTFDLHQHLLPEPALAALARRRRRPRLRGRRLELAEGAFELDAAAHDPDARLALLDRDGLDVAVLSLPPTLDPPPEVVDAYHEGVAELVGGRFRAFAAGRVLDGFAGACVPASALADLDALAPLLAELERRGLVLFVHPGPCRSPAGSPSWWASGLDYTAQMQAAYWRWVSGGAGRWPALPVLFAILAGGAPFQLERLASRGLEVREALQANVYLDTASYGPRALELCLSTFGVARVVYGSDLPVIDSRPTLRGVRSFGQAVADALCHANPTRLLHERDP